LPVEDRKVEPYELDPAEFARLQAINNDPNSVTVGQPWTGAMGVRETVVEIMNRGAPLQEADAPPSAGVILKPEMEIPWRRTRPSDPNAPQTSRWPIGDAQTAEGQAAAGHGGAPQMPQTVGESFLALTFGQSGFVIPPDTIADVGPAQILAVTNGRIRVFDKTGAIGGLNTTLNLFFQSVRGGITVGDPRIRYDRSDNRWFVTAITLAFGNRVVIAVSDGPTITSQSSFTFYFFEHDTVSPPGDTNRLFDYASLGVDINALYIGGNIFSSTSYFGTSGHVVRKSSVLSGGPIVVTAFRQMATSTGNGPFAPQGVSNDDPAATEGYFIGPDNAVFGRLTLRRISDPGGTPSISGNLNVTLPSTQFPLNVPAMGSTANLDALDDRVYQATIFLNQETGLRTLWTAHNIRMNTSGVSNIFGNRTGSRWYEIEDLTGAPTLRQSGSVFDSAAADFDYYWMPSVAMNRQGHAALGCSIAGTLRRAEIAAAGRLSSDTLGTMQTPDVVQTTGSDYNVEGGSVQRWGDYSSAMLDPADGMTIWTAQEYCNAQNSWAIRLIELVAPPPATPDSANPPTVELGATGAVVTIMGVSASGSGFFDPDPSFPLHISAAVDGGDVTVNSVTYIDPTTIKLNIDVAGGAALGARTVTVTNPDGQMAMSAGGILTLVPSCAVMGDLDENTFINGADIIPFVECLVFGTSAGNCACGDFDMMNMVDVADIPMFIAALGL
jgi:hypothetical protein